MLYCRAVNSTLSTPARRPSRFRPGRRLTVAALSALAIGAAAPTAASADASLLPSPSSDIVLNWYDATSTAVDIAGYPAAGNTQIAASRTWAIAWGAADSAIKAAPAGLTPKGRDAYTRAAFATAVHDAVLYLIPAAKAAVNATLQKTLRPVPGSAAKTAGKVAGAKAAAAAVKARKGDGLDPAAINAPFTPPTPALGVWRPTPPAFAGAVQSGQGSAKPFIIKDVAAKFVAPEPPAIDSPTEIADLQEVDALGSAISATRTPQQTEVAKFWAQTSVNAFTQVLRTQITGAGRPIAERVHDVALFHEVTTDAQIAIYASKYKYLRWRPITALRTDDGNPDTPYDPTFTSLIATPAHPEYPSGHAGYAGAAEATLAALFGAKPKAQFTITSSALPGTYRNYDAWSTLTQENVDARVWSGIHLRSTDVTSVAFGKSIAAAALKEAS